MLWSGGPNKSEYNDGFNTMMLLVLENWARLVVTVQVQSVVPCQKWYSVWIVRNSIGFGTDSVWIVRNSTGFGTDSIHCRQHKINVPIQIVDFDCPANKIGCASIRNLAPASSDCLSTKCSAWPQIAFNLDCHGLHRIAPDCRIRDRYWIILFGHDHVTGTSWSATSRYLRDTVPFKLIVDMHRIAGFRTDTQLSYSTMIMRRVHLGQISAISRYLLQCPLNWFRTSILASCLMSPASETIGIVGVSPCLKACCQSRVQGFWWWISVLCRLFCHVCLTRFLVFTKI